MRGKKPIKRDHADRTFSGDRPIEPLQKRTIKGGKASVGDDVKGRRGPVRPADRAADIDIPGPFRSQHVQERRIWLDIDAVLALIVEPARHRIPGRVPGTDIDVEAILNVLQSPAQCDIFEVLRIDCHWGQIAGTIEKSAFGVCHFASKAQRGAVRNDGGRIARACRR